MNNFIHILHLEDDALDAELVQATLKLAEIVCQIDRVQNRQEFTRALQQGKYDLVLGDYRLPDYDGVSALRLTQELRPELPFIFVSGTLGEDAAIEGFTQGATDYVLKQKLARLAPAIERALREAENRRLRIQAEAALHERVQQSQSLARLAKELERAQTYAEIVNAARAEVQAVIGYQNLWVYLLTEDRECYKALVADGELGERVMTSEGIATLKIQGDPMLEEIAAAAQIVLIEDARLDVRTDKAIVAQLGNRTIVNVPIILSDKRLGAVGTGTFGDEGVRVPTPSEQEYLMAMASHMAVSLDRLRLSEQRHQAEMALRKSEQKFRSFVEESSEGFTLVDEQGRIIEWNRAREQMTGLLANQVLGKLLWDVQYEMVPSELQTAEHYELTRQQIQNALRTGQAPFFENAIEAEVMTQAGKRRIVHQTVFPIKTDLGYRIGSVTSDITEHKQAEAALQTTKILLEQTFEQSPVPMVLVTMPNAMLRYINPACRHFLGIDDEPSLIDTPLMDIKPSWQDFDLQGKAGTLEQLPLVRSLAGSKTEGEERCIIRKDGTIRYELVSGTPIFNDAGQVLAGYLVMMDITERKHAEHALRESQALYYSFIEQLPNAVFRKDSEGRYVMVNPEFCRIKGIPAEEFLGRSPTEVARREAATQGENGPAIKYAGEGEETHELIMRTGKIVETEEEHPGADGKLQYTHVIRMPVFDQQGKVIGTQGIHFDVTERRRAEARILRLNRLYATLSQINQTIVHVRDRASLFEQICRVAVEHGQFRLAWIGLLDEAAGQLVPTVFAGEELGYLTNLRITYRDEQQGRGPTGTAIREGRCIICQDIATDPRMQPWRDAALQRGYRSTASVPIRQDGRVVGALTVYAAEPHSIDTEDKDLLDEIGLDISFALDGLEQEAVRQRVEIELSQLNAELEQRVAERTAELARAHEQLRAILDTAGEGVVFTDSRGAIEYINPAMERLTGYTADEALGRNPRLWKSTQTPEVTHQHMWRALSRGEIWQGEVINRRKDGGLYDAALTASPVTDLDGHIVGYVGVQRDITRQKELDRLKDQFVSNVSHELRTPLANVMLHINLLTRGRPERHDVYLRTLQREAERLRKMIEDLLDLSRLDRNVTPIRLASTDLQQLLEPLVLDRAALAAQRGLTLKYHPAPVLPVVDSDASMLTQVISNLLTNAQNYTPPGGEVTVLTAVQHTADQIWITVTVRDTGPGIAAKDLPHLFERFYRGEAGRKADAPGTGLGLAISQEIMERLGGRITVESEPGQGAAFTVWVKADSGGEI